MIGSGRLLCRRPRYYALKEAGKHCVGVVEHCGDGGVEGHAKAKCAIERVDVIANPKGDTSNDEQ